MTGDVGAKSVDSYKWLHRSLASYYRDQDLPVRDPVPFTPLDKPLSGATVAVITTAGAHLVTDEPFDVEREKREPSWGDPSYRVLPKTVKSGDVRFSHLHYKPEDALSDLDVLFPVPLLREFAKEGRVGRVAERHYSFMGFQLDPRVLLEEHLPKVIASLQEDGVDAVVLTPA